MELNGVDNIITRDSLSSTRNIIMGGSRGSGSSVRGHEAQGQRLRDERVEENKLGPIEDANTIKIAGDQGRRSSQVPWFNASWFMNSLWGSPSKEQGMKKTREVETRDSGSTRR